MVNKLAVKKGNDLALPDDVANMLVDDALNNSLDMDTQDFAMPFLAIVQSLSPQRKSNHEKHIPGAKEGDVFNTVTGELFDGGVTVVPCYYSRVYVEWKANRGGFVKVHDKNSDVVEKARDVELNGKMVKQLPNGNELAETAQHFVLIVREDGSTEQAVIALSFSGLSVSRKWNSIIAQAREMLPDGRRISPPRFARKYSLDTVERSNDKGSWFVFSPSPAGTTLDNLELYRAAREFAENMRQLNSHLDYSKSADGVDDEDADDGETDKPY
jgi:hypothetical protein